MPGRNNAQIPSVRGEMEALLRTENSPVVGQPATERLCFGQPFKGMSFLKVHPLIFELASKQSISASVLWIYFVAGKQWNLEQMEGPLAEEERPSVHASSPLKGSNQSNNHLKMQVPGYNAFLSVGMLFANT